MGILQYTCHYFSFNFMLFIIKVHAVETQKYKCHNYAVYFLADAFLYVTVISMELA